MAKLKNDCLDKSTLIRDIYRALFQNGRTYAAFEINRIIPLVEQLSQHKIILDPMSGYGTLMQACQDCKDDVSAFCIEYNPPTFFWQILNNPKNSTTLIRICNQVLQLKNRWPQTKEYVDISNSFYPDTSINLLLKLFELTLSVTKNSKVPKEDQATLTLAFLLPFVGRLSSCVQGNIVSHVKTGGMVVFRGWEKDFEYYINYLINYLPYRKSLKIKCDHTSILGVLVKHFRRLIPDTLIYRRLPVHPWVV